MKNLLRRPINNNNFLTWYFPEKPTVSVSTLTRGLHSGYHYRWRNFPDVLPIVAGIDTLVFYTNFENNSFFNGRAIKVVEETSCYNYSIVEDSTKYIVSYQNFGFKNLRITLNVPLSNLSDHKKFRLAIVQDEEVIHVSNYFETLRPIPDNVNNTHVFSFYGNSNIYNYEWNLFTEGSDLPYKVRIAGGIIDLAYITEKDIYTEATTGRPRTTRAINKKEYSFETYFATETLHDAISTASNYKYFAINNMPFVVESYEVSYERTFNLFKGVLKLKDVNFDRRISYC